MENMLTHYCPICKSELMYTPERMVCECGFKFPNWINDREITEDELIEFEHNKFTPVIKFTSKQGRECKVRLTLNVKERKVNYDFL